MTDETTRTTVKPPGSIQRAPAYLSPRNTNGRSRGDKTDIPCCRLQAQGPSAHLLLHHSGYK
ncbi:hypothetical protein Hanom_Chr08g00713791 [Helianthus anomalus]